MSQTQVMSQLPMTLSKGISKVEALARSLAYDNGIKNVLKYDDYGGTPFTQTKAYEMLPVAVEQNWPAYIESAILVLQNEKRQLTWYTMKGPPR